MSPSRRRACVCGEAEPSLLFEPVAERPQHVDVADDPDSRLAATPGKACPSAWKTSVNPGWIAGDRYASAPCSPCSRLFTSLKAATKLDQVNLESEDV